MVKTSFFSLLVAVVAVTSGLASAGSYDTAVQQQQQQQYTVGTVAPVKDVAQSTTSVYTASPVATTATPVATTTKPVATTAIPVTTAPATPLPTYTPAPISSTPSLPNWVGPKVGAPQDTACYRKSHLTKNCPAGYVFDKIATCWAQCPIEYPVQCGMECIPQNKDCTLEVIGKVTAVANVALNVATSGVFGQLSTASKAVQTGVKCGQQLYAATNKVVSYAKELEVSFPNTTQSQFSYMLSKSDFVVYDLPVAVTTCLGLPTPSGLDNAKEVVDVVKKILDQVTSKGESILDTQTFLNFTTSVGAGASVNKLSSVDLTSLKNLLSQGVTCGTELKSIIDRVTAAVKQIKTTSPSSAVDVIRVALSNSELFTKDIPAVTSSCVPKDASGAFQTRDDIRKTFQVIIDQIIDSSSNNGKPLSTADYALKIADFGLDAVAMFDPTGIAALAKEYIQPICGPTSILGEIDDGSLDQSLGLRTVGKAFEGSYGTWTKAGDGIVKLIFESTDSKDVRVNIMSGGDKIAEVPVKKGTTVTWTKPVADLKDKTMYLDRWRPGLFGLPGTGGGSLLIWIPHTSEGGHLELHTKINVS
uniref:Uncharacterized protein n=1 Tax=Globisporangium ultimum (strain ATCC 200006 / CBS 805.95 / DAOM BR144) TaxID=431595 RepID=K3WBK5_GLOUD